MATKQTSTSDIYDQVMAPNIAQGKQKVKKASPSSKDKTRQMAVAAAFALKGK
jgi:hypothetical protein